MRFFGRPRVPDLDRKAQEGKLEELKIYCDGQSLDLEEELLPRLERLRKQARRYTGRKMPPRLVQALRGAQALVETREGELAVMELGVLMMHQALALQDSVHVLQDVQHVITSARAALPKDMDTLVDEFREQVEAMREMASTLNGATRDMNFELTGATAAEAEHVTLELTPEEEARLLEDMDHLQPDDVPAPPAPPISSEKKREEHKEKRRRALLGA